MQHSLAGSALRPLLFAALATGLGCSDSSDTASGLPLSDELCSISTSEIFSGGPPKDGIPALTDPTLVPATDPSAGYVGPDERIIGLFAEEGPIAIPHQIMWWHEIVNIEVDGRRITATHCPLTGSSLAFDREPLGGVEFGVSGLLYRNNLVMYDRSSAESLWPQMSRGGRCGPHDQTALDMVPVMEMTWEAWSALYPDTRVVSQSTGFSRDYFRYPYGDYDELDNDRLLFPMSIDGRRPPKERVLGVPGTSGGVAYPFGEMAAAGAVAAIDHDPASTGAVDAVVFWDSSARAAMLYDRTVDATDLTFTVDGDRIVDVETGSEWRVDGLAVAGPHAGTRLEPVAEAYVAFWFAWAAFEPNTSIWSAP